MHSIFRGTATLRIAPMGRIIALLASLLLVSCNIGDDPVGTPVFVSGAPATNGVFDAALTQDGNAGLWMSYSVVNVLTSDPTLLRINTRIASSSNAGSGWTDVGVTLNTTSTVQVPDNQGIPTDALWQYEVSRILYDPNASPNPNWKIFWHRYPQANRIAAERLFQHGWIGVTTAPAVTGPWSTERKLLVGSLYDPATAATLGAPEYTSASLAISDCPIFTEPGALSIANNFYISLKCAGGSVGKVVLLRCNNDLTGCTYRGNLLVNSEAAQFTPSGQSSYDGFSATELVAVNGIPYLIVTPTRADAYRGCLVFEIADLAANPVTLVRVGGVASGAPVLRKSVAQTLETFNGACGYTAAASTSGIIFGEILIQGSTLQFGLYGSGVNLP